VKHFSILILLLLATSCDKDSEPTNNSILNGSYKNTSVLYSPAIDYNFDGKLETEIIDLFDKCTMDNLIVFVDSKVVTMIMVYCYVSLEQNLKLNTFNGGYLMKITQ